MPRVNPSQPVPGSKGTTLDSLRDRGVHTDPLRPTRKTPNPDAWSGLLQDKSEYLTTHELAQELGVSASQIGRWCHRWYGELPANRRGRGQGYRIHPHYRTVARAWMQTEDVVVREAVRKALAESPRNFVVVVANRASTHHTVLEAMRRVQNLLPKAANASEPVTILYVGPRQERQAT